MPLLNINSDRQISMLKKDFQEETGLGLLFYLGNEIVDGEKTISNIWRKKFTKDKARHLDFKGILHVWDFFIFSYKDSLERIINFFSDIIEIEIKISKDNKIIENTNLQLKDAIPKHFTFPTIDEERVIRLNERLIKIEKDLFNQWQILNPPLNQRLQNKNDWVQDYEYDILLHYYLDEKDPLYDEKYDNIIVQQTHFFPKANEKWDDSCMNDNNLDFREERGVMDFVKERHCWFFHEVSDHTRLSATDIQRIGNIHVDIQVEYQHNYEI